jgi:hypothetical protein
MNKIFNQYSIGKVNVKFLEWQVKSMDQKLTWMDFRIFEKRSYHQADLWWMLNWRANWVECIHCTSPAGAATLRVNTIPYRSLEPPDHKVLGDEYRRNEEWVLIKIYTTTTAYSFFRYNHPNTYKDWKLSDRKIFYKWEFWSQKKF